MKAALRTTLSEPQTTRQSVRRLQITSSRLASGIFAGEYSSAFRGRGIEFDEVREYQPGDDVRSIDWNVTARLDRPFVKRFVEERELSVLMVLDSSASMDFGTVRATKHQTAVEAIALIAYAALRSNDRVGLISDADKPESYIHPAKGKRHVMRLVHQAHSSLERNSAARLEAALLQMNKCLKGRALILILSDFLDPIPLRLLASVSKHHDLVAVQLYDPAEREMPSMGLVQLRDPETGTERIVDSASQPVRENYRKLATLRSEAIKNSLTSAGAEILSLDTGTSPLHPLIRFFRKRAEQRRR